MQGSTYVSDLAPCSEKTRQKKFIFKESPSFLHPGVFEFVWKTPSGGKFVYLEGEVHAGADI